MSVFEKSIDWEIGWLKEEIEKSAPNNYAEERGVFYQNLGEKPKKIQRKVLIGIYGCVCNPEEGLTRAVEKKKDEAKKKRLKEAIDRLKEHDRGEVRKHEKARKTYEYIRRSLRTGKTPKVGFPDPLLLIPLSPLIEGEIF